MKTQYKVFVSLLIAICGFTGCNEDDTYLTPDGNAELLNMSALIDGYTEAESAVRFQGGENVGFWLSEKEVTGSLNDADVRVNTRFAQSAGGLVSEPRVHWDDNQVVNYYAYTPYDVNANENPEQYVFQVNLRQDSAALNKDARSDSDFLWAKGKIQRQGDPEKIYFHHLMSKVVMNIKSTSETPGSFVGSTVSIKSQASATIDLGTGSLQPTGDVMKVVGFAHNSVPGGYEAVREMVMVPQTIAKGTEFIHIMTLGNFPCVWKADRELVFESGKQYLLDVIVDEGECEVVIKEITDWKESTDVIIGDANVQLPHFKLYDYYDHHGVKGIVIDVDETGTHGLIMSADHAVLQWAKPEVSLPFAEDNNDANYNYEECLYEDPTLESFPAMKWCYDKNKDGVTGWYMPSFNETKIFAKIISDWDSWAKLWYVLRDCPFESNQVDLDWNDYNSFYLLYSSTLSYSGDVKAAGCNIQRGMFFGSYYDDGSRFKATDVGYVRAMHKF